jgi:hypothetical protein
MAPSVQGGAPGAQMAFHDKEKPQAVRMSNIEAAKGMRWARMHSHRLVK